MSATSTPTDSPVHVEPLHNPSQAAQVVVPQAPLGNATNGLLKQAPGMGAKALLAKKMAKGSNPKFVSPTDNLMTPCSQKLNAAKKKHFNKAPKPMQQLSLKEESSESASSDEELCEDKMDVADSTEQTTLPTLAPKPAIEMKMDDEENPF